MQKIQNIVEHRIFLPIEQVYVERLLNIWNKNILYNTGVSVFVNAASNYYNTSDTRNNYTLILII